MNRFLPCALLFASLAVHAEDRRIEAVRADADAPPIRPEPAAADAPPIRPEPAAVDGDKPRIRGPMPDAGGGGEGTGLPVHVGAMMGLVSLPRPMDVELYARILDFGWVGVSYSDFPAFLSDPLLSAAGLKNGQTTARVDKFSSWEADLRVFPFASTFFVGSSFGRQSLLAAVTQSTPAGPQTATVALTTVYATPRIGSVWTIGPGLVVGADAGVQLKLGGSRRVTVPPLAAGTSAETDANRMADIASSFPLPSVHFRIGWQY